MNKQTFKFIRKDRIDGTPIIYIIYETDIQSFAKANFGRILKDKELQDVSNAFSDEEKAWENIQHGIYEAIDSVLRG